MQMTMNVIAFSNITDSPAGDDSICSGSLTRFYEFGSPDGQELGTHDVTSLCSIGSSTVH
jgi:hypothetical protein